MNRCVERLLGCRPYEPKQQERRAPHGRQASAREPPAQGADGAQQSSGEGAIPRPPQPFTDMVLSRQNVKGDAEVFIRCFHRVRGLGWEGVTGRIDIALSLPKSIDL